MQLGVVIAVDLLQVLLSLLCEVLLAPVYDLVMGSCMAASSSIAASYLDLHLVSQITAERARKARRKDEKIAATRL